MTGVQTCALPIYGFKSRHTGGVQFVFGDGSVHFLSSSINGIAYENLCNKSSGGPFGDY